MMRQVAMNTPAMITVDQPANLDALLSAGVPARSPMLQGSWSGAASHHAARLRLGQGVALRDHHV